MRKGGAETRRRKSETEEAREGEIEKYKGEEEDERKRTWRGESGGEGKGRLE